MAGRLAGKVVVITGSTRGIGCAIARSCAADGATVVVNGRTPAGVERAVVALHAEGVSVVGIAANVSSPSDVRRLFDESMAVAGHIDVWFNNAGLAGGFRPLEELPAREILDIVDTNVAGVMLCCGLVVPYMRERGGTVVNMCGRGSSGEVAAFGAAYASTKAAVASLTRSLAAENRSYANVSIHGLIPGMVATDFYVDMDVSPLLADRVGNVTVALDAFGVPVEEVGTFCAGLAAEAPGRSTGTIHTLIGPVRRIRGVAKLILARASGKMKRL